ncbi:MAG: undecaprenyl/decaprenyl-phosphate alpha-N-acetylglucosaminyl 1-phosphate transferase [Actinobacteria bacterium]|nr:MAG: undecaprenyl/decaprenyl-phosphate alpha-N-acetylglucosaminyl 1-phosphate transferase [Actinomycetota bacterium]RIK03050.1 MAG: undecaprenyl/decaprenyl-phosphate alpha-N-acetylglucosaminyl 1-phosphate transferase [Acidobacteriota bacterium]
MAWYLVILGVAALSTYLLVPLVRRYAIRLGAVVGPSERRVHSDPTPTLGGLAMLLGVGIALTVASQLDEFEPVFETPTAIIGTGVAAAVIYGVGFIDDMREMSAPAKTAGMVLAGSILTLAGVTIIYFRVPFAGFVVLSPDLSALISVLWVVGMANAVNLIDGLDGLAAGIVGIAAGAFFLYGTKLDEAGVLDPSNVGPLIAITTAGVCVGFLPHNLHPARIFMGDGGALMLGLLLAASTMAVGGQSDDPFSGQAWFFFAPLVIPIVILGVPILDTLMAIVRRATRRSGVATADKEHLHHRLMRLGHGQRRSVLILWTWTALLSGLALYPVYTGKGDAIVPLGLAALALLLYTVFHPQVRRSRNAAGQEDGEAADRVAEGPSG